MTDQHPRVNMLKLPKFVNMRSANLNHDDFCAFAYRGVRVMLMRREQSSSSQDLYVCKVVDVLLIVEFETDTISELRDSVKYYVDEYYLELENKRIAIASAQR
ncbi:MULTISPECIES: hypothetical protein [Vibrio]|uniref:Uncharacterized protein n=2 Tax=Vibrio coralliirubri TaxID=1516159 RepID=A0AA87C060_9VIBR|nr:MULTISPECIES: hypothetical protein [Vibrio]MCK8081420.1 hypothetical protein [Vibrio sp. 1CM24A]CDT65091.1 hypothetical protein VCR31J2_1270822 [Vibrio coralliirubri]CDT70959.1 hypothetical protein VCR15J2_470831 [Vibrio coralliirubri]